ncbi:hypothetical protein SAMN05428944_7390 [Streptomyces sp. 1222.5]|uniref:hypothetical protein n=1 Tax=unclassified Streptomyces TaxID=2593676 RepID=UPI0008984B80|nr:MULTISPECIES: hypothetical protein [unclassified Streptomyces]PKW05584.1 hypothetical protein BX260_0701 [Streptomyces sp. 5112.2]SED34909.1 hypothetical protein SAMN05428944_7390 [Streptomyces sp. 1222.5]
MSDHDQPAARHRCLSDAEAAAEARRIIAEACQPVAQIPTAYRDTVPLPAYGTTPPITQPESRIVPAWAAGTAVAGIGVGAAFVGIGCAIWLACQGFAAVTLTSVLFITLPIAALAAVITAIGSAARAVKATRTTTHHHYAGPVRQETNTITAPAYGLIARNRNELRP